MMLKHSLRLLSFALILCFGSHALALEQAPEEASEPPPSPPDEVVLKDGSRVLGTVTSTRDGVVTLETAFAGTLSITQSEVESMNLQTPAVMKMADGEVAPEQAVNIEGEQIELVMADGASRSYAISDLTIINPDPWELGQGYKWYGLASVALEAKSGNSDTQELDYRLESYWRSLKNRYSIIFNGEQDEQNDLKSADNWTLIGKYDRFTEGKWYYGGSVFLESDEFKDLDLRYMIGPYAGRQFFEQDIFSMEAELGLAYVNEDFIVAEDQEYPGANWTVRMSSNYLGGDSRLYLDHIGIWNLDETSDIVLNTTLGLAFPLLFNFEAAAEILWEYDSGAVEGVEDLDETYTFRIGYTW